jgi:hypothetical protein
MWIANDIPDLTIKDIERFSRFFVIQEKGCWTWQGFLCNGYGRFRIGKLWLKPHRIMYKLATGKLDNTLWIDHLCRNGACVNPSHLEQVSHKENVIRGLSQALYPNHCKRGHEYTPGNTRLGPIRKTSGTKQRICKTCEAPRKKLYRLKNRRKVMGAQ